jgi:micrococcal nuclease
MNPSLHCVATLLSLALFVCWSSPAVAKQDKRLCTPRSFPAVTLDARVVGVNDGDTVKAVFPADSQFPGQQAVRLLEIDAPESGQAFGNRSKQKLSELAFGRTLRFTITGNDRYCRPLALINSADGSINLMMVESGMAWFNQEYGRVVSIKRAEAEAKAAKRGLWIDPAPIYPGVWRKAKREGTLDALQGAQ